MTKNCLEVVLVKIKDLVQTKKKKKTWTIFTGIVNQLVWLLIKVLLDSTFNKAKALNWRKFLSNSAQRDFRTKCITPQGNNKSKELGRKRFQTFTQRLSHWQITQKKTETVSERQSPSLFQSSATAVIELLQSWASMELECKHWYQYFWSKKTNGDKNKQPWSLLNMKGKRFLHFQRVLERFFFSFFFFLSRSLNPNVWEIIPCTILDRSQGPHLLCKRCLQTCCVGDFSNRP